MTDKPKSEAQLKREKEAVAAMKGAKDNMTMALDRIETVEQELRYALSTIQTLRTILPSNCYVRVAGATNEYKTIDTIALAAVERIETTLRK